MRLHIFAIIVVLTAGFLAAQAPPVPAAYQDLYNTLTTQIAGFDTAVSAGWNGSSYPYLDAPQLQAAGADQYTSLLETNTYPYSVLPQLDELQALGAKAVTVHIDFPILYQPFYTYSGNPSQYQQFVSFYQQLAQDIRARGMKVVVEATLYLPLVGTNVSEFQSYLSTLSWSQYMAGRAANALAVAQLIEPDYMTVMTEPDSEATVSGQTNLNTVTGVTQLVQQVLTTLQDAGVKNVQIGAGAGTWTKNYMEYVQAFVAMPLNFVDMHIYPVNEKFFTNAITAAQTIHAAGKQVGMSECWAWKIRDSELGVLDFSTISGRNPFSFWAPVDTAFLQAIVNLAKYQKFAFISPFWVHYFFNTLDYNTYGSLPLNTVLTDSFAASAQANLVGAITSTGHAWESQNIPPDTIPPSTPAAPTGTAGTTTINLQWAPDTDNVGVSAYNLYRNGTLLSTTSVPLYYDNGLVSGETYTYNLTATDASGNVSAMSAPLVIETIDITAPSVPTNLVVTGMTSGSVSLNWKPSTGIGGVGGYRVLRGTSPGSMSIQADVTAPPYTNAVLPSTTYYYAVESYNPIGITSAPGNQVTVTTPAPPAIPANLAAGVVSCQQIKLTWSASTDLKVAGYYVFRGTTPAGLSQVGVTSAATSPSFISYPLTPGTTYYFGVEAVDTSGNVSPMSAVSAATLAPPAVPASLVATAVSPKQIVLTWTAGTSGMPIAAYNIYRGTSPSSLSKVGARMKPSYTDYPLTPATTYYYAVQAEDSGGDFSPLSATVSATTLALPAAPLNLVATPLSPKQIGLSWTAGTSGMPIAAYDIYRGTTPSSLSQVGVTKNPFYTDYLLTPGTTYYYAVQGEDSGGDFSPLSATVSATTP